MAPEGPTALIALGSNLADPWRQLRWAGGALAELGSLQARSGLWLSDPVGGPVGQPPYLNAVVVLRPDGELRSAPVLMRALHRLEAQRGRVRRLQNAPRTLDLDLIDLAGGTAPGGWPVLPHPRAFDRPFVLAPLLEVAPDWRHPRSGVSAASQLARLGRTGLRRTSLRW
jgi:2-amino-4-hydroxy-6-hydroxymethyldihydropteridine diphosphokinase